MNQVQSTTVKAIARHMRQLREEGRSTALLVGAGISVSAGIPLADTMVSELRNDPRYNYRFEDLKLKEGEREYNMLMQALTYKQREEYLRGYINDAKINLSHLIIGMLIKEGYVSTVLTTNFDPLLVKTMALFNHHTYVYDLANIREYVSDSVMSPNIFYLHGQGHAFLMLNTEDELDRPREYFQTLINDMMHDHFFLVAGYSGLTDFIFNAFCSFPRFPSDLHWVGYKSPTPPDHVLKQLCDRDSVRYINSNGADSFFRDLANELKIPYAPFLDKPFDHLKALLADIGTLEYNDGQKQQHYDVIRQPLLKINTAIKLIEENLSDQFNADLAKVDMGEFEATISALNYGGLFNQVIARKDEILKTGNDDVIHNLSIAYRSLGAKFFADENVEEGNKWYHEASLYDKKGTILWNWWGADLIVMANKHANRDWFTLGFEKLEQAIVKNPTDHMPPFNYSIGLMFMYLLWGDKEKLDEAIIWSHRTNEMVPHITDYNLACFYVLKGDIDNALLMLESSINHKNVNTPKTREVIETDDQLKALVGNPAFTALLDKYFPRAAVAR